MDDSRHYLLTNSALVCQSILDITAKLSIFALQATCLHLKVHQVLSSGLVILGKHGLLVSKDGVVLIFNLTDFGQVEVLVKCNNLVVGTSHDVLLLFQVLL